LNLAGFDTTLPEEYRRIVIHEFGHAIGFEHEHQNPQGGCDGEFNWEKIYAELCKPPNRWTREMVNDNLRGLPNSTAYLRSQHDPKSIMHYSFDSWMFNQGKASPCYVEPVSDLSELDIAGAQAAYRRNSAAQNDESERRFQGALRSLPAQATEARRVIARAMISLEEFEGEEQRRP
jgi:hypothetical protein